MGFRTANQMHGGGGQKLPQPPNYNLTISSCLEHVYGELHKTVLIKLYALINH